MPDLQDISDAAIDAQMQVLDEAFRPVGFKFNLKETIRTVNAQWYTTSTASP
jgi:hypothetical protein